MVVLEPIVEMSGDLLDLLGVIVRPLSVAPVFLEGEIGDGAAGCPTETEIDPAGCERVENAEGFGHVVRAVMIEQYRPGADPDVRRLGGEIRHQHFGARTGDPADEVAVFRDPEARIAEFFGVTCPFDGVLEGLRCRPTLRNGSEIDDR